MSSSALESVTVERPRRGWTRLTTPRRNDAFPWDRFDVWSYFKHNYMRLRDDDQQILRLVGRHFARTAGRSGWPAQARGLDVGTGPNLYPALAMLPFCSTITLCERAQTNVDWLRTEVAHFGDTWDPFWNTLRGYAAYRDVHDPRAALAVKADVRKGNIFDLRGEPFDIGTMFFVAESCTADPTEFTQAVRSFIGALRPGAPFAAAFMLGSRGYDVGDFHFPAVHLTRHDIQQSLSGLVHRGSLRRTSSLKVRTITTAEPLREGYDGMVLALGRAGSTEVGG